MRRLLAAAIALTGCVLEGPAPDLEVDMGRSCDAIALEVRDPGVLPGWQVHALAAVHSDGERVWALASDGKNQLRLKTWPDGPEHDLSGLGNAGEFHLIAGPRDGETWLLLNQPLRALVWRIDENAEVLPEPASLLVPDAAFEFHWRLVFLGERPHLLGIPRLGDVGTTILVYPIDPMTLALGKPGTEPLMVLCQTEACGDSPSPGTLQFDPVATVAFGPLGGAALLIGVYSTTTPEMPPATNLYRSQLLQLQLRSLGAGRMPEVSQSVIPFAPTVGDSVFSPAFLVADDSGYYGLVGQTPLGSGPVPEIDLVFRMARREPFTTIATAQRSLRSHLLQVGSRGALGQIAGETWTIAPLNPDGVDTERVAALRVAPETTISSAGRGEFLVRDEGQARRVVAACVQDE